MKSFTFCKEENREIVTQMAKEVGVEVTFPGSVRSHDNGIRVIADGNIPCISKFDMRLYEIENGVKHPSIIEREKEKENIIKKLPWWKRIFS